MASHYLELYEDADPGNEIIFEDTDEGLEQAKATFRYAFYSRIINHTSDANGRIMTTLDEFIEFYESLVARLPYLQITRRPFGSGRNNRNGGDVVYDIDAFIEDETLVREGEEL